MACIIKYFQVGKLLCISWMHLTCLVVVFISSLVALIKWVPSCLVAVPHMCKGTLMRSSRLSIIFLSFTLPFYCVNQHSVCSWFICRFLAATFCAFGKVICIVLKSQLSSVARWPGCHQGLGATRSSWASTTAARPGSERPSAWGLGCFTGQPVSSSSWNSPITDPYL